MKRDRERKYMIEYIHRNEQDITSHKHTFQSNKYTKKIFFKVQEKLLNHPNKEAPIHPHAHTYTPTHTHTCTNTNTHSTNKQKNKQTSKNTKRKGEYMIEYNCTQLSYNKQNKK